jgi:hypothetical protein
MCVCVLKYVALMCACVELSTCVHGRVSVDVCGHGLSVHVPMTMPAHAGAWEYVGGGVVEVRNTNLEHILWESILEHLWRPRQTANQSDEPQSGDVGPVRQRCVGIY